MSVPSYRTTFVASLAFCAVLSLVLVWPASRHVDLDVRPGHTPPRVTISLPSLPPPKAPLQKTTNSATYRTTAYVAPHTSTVGGTQSKTALIIGISDAAGNTEIDGARADASLVRQALVDYGFPAQGIQMLVDAQATRPAILNALNSLAARTAFGGIAVFAVSAHGSGSSFRTYEGARVGRSEVGAALGRIRGRVWSFISMCYAAGFDVAGIAGPGRVATFSSSATDLTWETPGGSDLAREMIQSAMIEGHAPQSVEAAFAYARSVLNPSGHIPVIDDQVPGDLVLGPVTWLRTPAPKPPPPPVATEPLAPDPQSVAAASPTPAPPRTWNWFGGLFGHRR